MSLRLRLARPLAALAGFVAGDARAQLASVTARVDDSPGWTSLSGRPHDRPWSEIADMYRDALTAWRKNPLAKRTIDITTDYVVGDGITLSSPFPALQSYIDAFWHHPKNMMALRLATISDELTLVGDVFPVLFTNPYDGLSYIRFVTKDTITRIHTHPNDWELELVYRETRAALDPRRQRDVDWYGAGNPAATGRDPIMFHYSVNRPLGALMGEGDLATLIPWLLRYSRMLEDRVRLHWAVRAFLWFIRVPSNRVEEKQEEYSSAPEAGSVIVHDDAEEWEVKTPMLRGNDASHDLEAVRRMIYAGSGMPPHWYGERGSNLAEAQAMVAPAERHLKARQNYLVYALQDLIAHGYRRARDISPAVPALPHRNYNRLFIAETTDISRTDNEKLAAAGRELTEIYKALALESEPRSRTLTEKLLAQVFRFMGEPQEAATIRTIVDEVFTAIDRPDPSTPPTSQHPVPERANGQHAPSTTRSA